MLVFKGIQKTTLIDFPGKVAATLFLSGCNFRCPFCYNPQLVFEKETGFSMDEKEALNFLKERKGFIDGVCITGGEPTLHKGLPEFCRKAKALGLAVKLDTNGTNPEMLKKMINEKLVDYIAMDIKAAPEKYAQAVNAKVDIKKIKESISLVMDSGIDYEFRTTVVKGMHTKEELVAIGKWAKGARRFFIQQFNPKAELVDTGMKNAGTYPKEELEEFAKLLTPYFGQVAVR